MATIKREAEFHCFNDCKQSGCPGHKLDLSIQTTSEIMSVYVDGELLFAVDPEEWKAIKSMLYDMYYDRFNLK